MYEPKKMSVSEYESALKSKTIDGVFGALWPDVNQKKFKTSIYDLYSSLGNNTDKSVLYLFYEINKLLHTFTYANARTCAATGFYCDTDKELHVIMNAGSNGFGYTLKQSLEYVVKMIGTLEELGYEYYMTDSSFDNVDDLYTFYFVINIKEN
jgi:hypothetical protein